MTAALLSVARLAVRRARSFVRELPWLDQRGAREAGPAPRVLAQANGGQPSWWEELLGRLGLLRLPQPVPIPIPVENGTRRTRR